MPVRTRVPGGWQALHTTYTAVYLIWLLAWPFLTISERTEAFGGMSPFLASVAVSGGMVLLLMFVSWRCSSYELSFWRGLNVVAESTSVIDSWFALVTVLPALTITTVAALGIAACSSKSRAENRFIALVRWFYEHRLWRHL